MKERPILVLVDLGDPAQGEKPLTPAAREAIYYRVIKSGDDGLAAGISGF